MRQEAWAGAISSVAARGMPPSPEMIRTLVREEEVRLGGDGVRAEQRRLESGLLGLGELAEAVADPGVTDVLVNGDGRVWVDRGGGVEASSVCLSVAQARSLAVRLAGLAGRRLDDAQPWVDGLLPGGTRLHAILPPLVAGGAHISLRIPRVSPRGLEGLVAIGGLSAGSVPLVRRILERRLTFVVVGGTGTGKTTLAAGLLAACPADDRIVVVEDVRELAPGHPHVVHLQGRSANVEGVGGVNLVDLVRQALRMRPDRLVVGEVRGPEVRELLSAFNTGHRGGGGTVHANSIADLPARFEALGALASMSARAVRTQLLGGVHVVFGMDRHGSIRRLSDIGVVVAGANRRAEVHLAYSVDGPRPTPGPGAGVLEALLSGRGRGAGRAPEADSRVATVRGG